MRIIKPEVPNTKYNVGNTRFDTPNTNAENVQAEIQATDFKPHTNIAIFASGAGTNAQNIIRFFKDHPHIRIKVVVCNKPEAGVLDIAKHEKIESVLITREAFYANGAVEVLKKNEIDFIVFAGFLLKAPQVLIDAFPKRIINIHPALLPKHGGKGMYGANVHNAVIAAGDKESGITIHYVDEHYDRGDIIFQAKFEINSTDAAKDVAEKIHQLEYEHFPRVIEECIYKI